MQKSAAESWRLRVESHHEQSLKVMDESWRQGDFWKNLAPMFRADPRRNDDEALNAISELIGSVSTVLDVGGGAGRFAIALSLKCESVTVVDPSESMLEQLQEATNEAGQSNVASVHSEWETAEIEPEDVVLCSHVVYGVADIIPFIEKINAHARRRVVLLSFVDSPQSNVAALWEPVHGERRINLPAMPELVNVLWEMDVYPSIRMLTSTRAQSFESVDAATEELSNRLFLAQDSPARQRLEAVIEDYLESTDEGWRVIGARPVRQGVIWWDTESR
ncbi:MAG: class I SAM-dependent methyltransferase [Dehalococcoidia bacterium]|nr:class I SAM-dependent methyltransferase [Dehalococcoidia bacterium]